MLDRFINICTISLAWKQTMKESLNMFSRMHRYIALKVRFKFLRGILMHVCWWRMGFYAIQYEIRHDVQFVSLCGKLSQQI